MTFKQFSEELQLSNVTSPNKKYFINKETTIQVIRETHALWEELLQFPGEDDVPTGQRYNEAGKFVPIVRSTNGTLMWKPAYRSAV